MSEPIPDSLPIPAPIEATAAAPEPAPPEYLQPCHDEDLFTEYGLQTPDGAIHWGQFRGNDISTPESRFMMRLSIRKTAVEVGYDPEIFVASYRWVGRVVEKKTDRVFTDAGVVPIDSDAAAPPPAQPQPQQNGQAVS